MPRDTEGQVTSGDLVTLVRRGIADLADPVKAPAMQAYMKSLMPYRGVTSQPLSRLCRELFGSRVLADEEAWHATVLALWDGAEFREERYAATSLARHRHYREHQQPHTLGLYRHLVVTGAWWDHVDEVATHLVRGLLESCPGTITPELDAWATDDDLWVRRSAIICQVGRRADLDPGPAGRRDRRQPGRLDASDARRVAVRQGVLHPQGDRLGAPRPRPNRSGMGPSVRRRTRRTAERAEPARGAQAPLRRRTTTQRERGATATGTLACRTTRPETPPSSTRATGP